MKKLLLLAFCLTICANVFGQSKEITEKEFKDSVDSARDRLSTDSYRANSKLVVNRDGKVYLTVKWQRAFLTPNKKYYKNVRTTNGEAQTVEQTKIGKIIYCRENNGKWTRSKSSCEISSISPVSKIEESKFSADDVKLKNEDVKLYENNFIYSSGFSGSPIRFFKRHKIWINKDGLLLREEVENGSVGEEMPNKEVIVYEYNPKDLKIEAPIK